MDIKVDDWHGVPRDEIEWHPTVEHELCTGCGLYVLGCSAGFYAFDFEKNKPVVVAPLKCKVECVTYSNKFPRHAIIFPPLSYLHKIVKKKNILTASRSELKASKGRITYEE